MDDGPVTFTALILAADLLIQNISSFFRQAAFLARMADDGPCFGFKKKTVVMTCIGLCCLALVIWTILVTSRGGKEEKETW